jgi:hypothetical protein
VLADVAAVLDREEPLIGCEMPYARKSGKGKIKLLRTQAAALAYHPRMLSWARIFFVHGTMPARRPDRGTVRTQERFPPSLRSAPSMTDYRVRHLVTG